MFCIGSFRIINLKVSTFMTFFRPKRSIFKYLHRRLFHNLSIILTAHELLDSFQFPYNFFMGFFDIPLLGRSIIGTIQTESAALMVGSSCKQMLDWLDWWAQRLDLTFQFKPRCIRTKIFRDKLCRVSPYKRKRMWL